jgi:hypothetical protein
MKEYYKLPHESDSQVQAIDFNKEDNLLVIATTDDQN